MTAPSVYDSGFGGGPCVADYTLAVAESDRAVAVRAVPKPGITEPRFSVECLNPLTFSVTLSAPLGNRVLLGVTGAETAEHGPVPVVESGAAPASAGTGDMADAEGLEVGRQPEPGATAPVGTGSAEPSGISVNPDEEFVPPPGGPSTRP